MESRMRIRVRVGGMRRRLVTGCLGLLAVMLTLPAWPEIMAGAWSFATAAAKPLVNSTKAAQGVTSYGFCSGVGGIAFGAVAEFTDGSRVVGITYAPTQPDGQRVQITLDKGDEQHAVTLPIYDWIAIPVAHFAQENQDAIFTLFGDLLDAEEDARRTRAGQRILNYHAAFKDTLLGLRLMQADLLAFHPVAPENLTDGGHPLQAPGESLRDVARNRRDFDLINELYRSGKPRSYVITDVDQGVHVRLRRDEQTAFLEFQGNPHWSCWRLTKEIDAIQEDWAEQPDLAERLQQRVMRKALSGTVSIDEDNVEAIIRQLMVEEGRSMLSEYIDQHYFERLTDLSRRLSDRMAELEGGNPPVYRTLVQTMHYAALFRHIKAESPQAYAAFMRQIVGVKPEPRVSTPTVLIPPSN